MLTPCARCHRHARVGTPCPFCARVRAPRTFALPVALPLALGLAGCGGVATLGPAADVPPRAPSENTNGDETPPPREDELLRTAPAYGAAPLPPPPAPPTEREDDPRPASAYGAPPVPAGPGSRAPRE